MAEINLEAERNVNFSARDSYDIIADAIEASYDNGFMNNFVFERAIILGATAALYPDDFPYDKEVYDSPREAIKVNPLDLWDDVMQNTKLFDSLLEKNNDQLDAILAYGINWFNEYKDYAYSLRGLLDNIGPLMDEVTQRADQELAEMYQNGDLKEVIDIGKDWGYERDIQKSLFADESAGETPIINLA